MTNAHRITRRSMLEGLGALGVTVTLGTFERAPAAAAGADLGVHETVEAGLERLFGSRPMKDGRGAIKFEVPLIAENGAVVPVTVEANLPMTPTNHVKHIYIVADKNRIPIVTRVAFAPEAGQAYMGANIRLGETGNVRAIVEQSDGTLLAVQREVKVTVGGCGG